MNNFQAHLKDALRIGIGCVLAIYIAHLFNLKNAPSAGTIALLTLLVNTRKQTLKLAGERIITYAITVVLSGLIFHQIHEVYLAFMLFMVLLILICEIFGWAATLSVNTVIGVHFLINQDFSLPFIFEEFMLLMIGIAIALGLNLVQRDRTEREKLIRQKEQVDAELDGIMQEAAQNLTGNKTDIISRIDALKIQIEQAIEASARIRQNSFMKQDQLFLPLFEAKYSQTAIMHELVAHMEKAAQTEALDMVARLMEDITQSGDPQTQLKQIEETMRQLELFYKNNEEGSFHDHAMLLFVLYDLNEIVELKMPKSLEH